MLHIAIGLVVVVIYGTTLLFSLAPRDGISWQGHLFGAIGGVVAAWWLDRRDRQNDSAPGRSSPRLSSV